MFAGAIVREVDGFAGVRGVEAGRSEGTFDREGAAFFGGLLGFQNDFEDVVGVFFGDEWSFVGVWQCRRGSMSRQY